MNPCTNSMYPSETSKHRPVILQYCNGTGIDIGFGGDPISPSALRMDLPNPYATTGEYPVQLPGDCRNLFWLRDSVLDFVYSSHVLEDFGRTETEDIMREWFRVIRTNGVLVLLLPDQPRYVAYCRKDGQYSADSGIYGNQHHSIENFSLEYVVETAKRIGGVEVVAEHPELGEYSFLVVIKKIAASTEMIEVEHLRSKLRSHGTEIDRLKQVIRDMERDMRMAKFVSIVRRILAKIRRSISS